jgi:hypothetical protein
MCATGNQQKLDYQSLSSLHYAYIFGEILQCSRDATIPYSESSAHTCSNGLSHVRARPLSSIPSILRLLSHHSSELTSVAIPPWKLFLLGFFFFELQHQIEAIHSDQRSIFFKWRLRHRLSRTNLQNGSTIFPGMLLTPPQRQ